MSDQTTETKDSPRITYIGLPVKSEPKQKNPKRVAAGKRQAALKKGKEKLLKGKESESLEN